MEGPLENLGDLVSQDHQDRVVYQVFQEDLESSGDQALQDHEDHLESRDYLDLQEAREYQADRVQEDLQVTD